MEKLDYHKARVFSLLKAIGRHRFLRQINQMIKSSKERIGQQKTSILKNHLLPLILFGLIAVWASWPLIKYFNTRFIGWGDDALHHIWTLWHTKEWILGNTDLFFTRHLYYPQGISMLNHSLGPVMGIIVFPFWYLSPMAAYNGAAFLGIWLTGYCGYLLARTFNLKWFSSVFVGLILLLAPIHLAGVLGHIWKTFLGFLPLTIICIKHSLDPRKSIFWIFGSATIVVLSLLYAGYNFVYAVIAITYFSAISLIEIKRGFGKITLQRMSLLFFTILVFVMPMIILIVRSSDETVVDLHLQSAHHTPDIIQFLLPSIYHPLFGSKVVSILEGISPSTLINLDTNVSLFYSGIFLFTVAAMKTWKQSKWWICFTGICILLVFGPNLKIFGITEFTSYKLPIIMPYAFLTDLPWLGFIRVPGKLMPAAYVGFSVTAGFGMDWIINHTSKRIKPILIVVLTSLLLFEGWTGPWPVSELPEPPNFYKQLAHDNKMFGVVDIPVNNPHESATYMIYQMTHRKGIVDGYLSRYPAYHPFFRDLMEPTLPQDIHVDGKANSMTHYENLLANNNYKYIVMHKDLKGDDLFGTYSEWIFANKEPFYEDNRTLVYEIIPNDSNMNSEASVTAFHGRGWHDYESSLGIRWAQSPSELIVFSNHSQSVTLSITPKWIFDPENENIVGSTGSLSVVINDDKSKNLDIELSGQTTTCITLDEGWNQIWITASSGNFIPGELIPGSNDSRLLSFALSNIEFYTSSGQELINSQNICENYDHNDQE